MNLPHEYAVSAVAASSGNVKLVAEGLPELASAPPKQFNGPGDLWSPEDLLVAAVADCFVLSFRAVATASKLDWIELNCQTVGKLDKIDRVMAFTQFTVQATVTVPIGTDETKVNRALEKAEQVCLITNSLNGSTKLITKIEFQ